MELSQKALGGIKKLFLFWDRMNPQKAWMAELEVASFFYQLYRHRGSVFYNNYYYEKQQSDDHD